MPKSWSSAESFSDRISIPILFLLVSESTELQVLPSNKCLCYSIQSSGLASEEVLGESAYSVHAWSVDSVMPASLQPHGLQPARLLCPWDSPGKNTGVGCHVFLHNLLYHCQNTLYGIFLVSSRNQIKKNQSKINLQLLNK